MATIKVRTFNIGKFTAAVRDAREEALSLIGSNKYIQTYRDALRFMIDEEDYLDTDYVETARTIEDLRDELVTASRAAYLDGASDAQINLIVSLCAAKGDFARMGYSRLTVKQASNLIADLKKEA